MKMLSQIRSKIKTLDEIIAASENWRSHNKRIAFTNGCFDIVHLGHVDYLSRAADLADVLIIGVNTDASVSRIKGSNRPLQDELSRSMLLASFQFVTAVVLFGDDTPYGLIKAIQPDVLVKGSDYEEADIVGADIVRDKGGEIVAIDFLDGYSTSSIIEKANNAS
jgi:rfaE bifunctional protein nucleotidyltransferase chain/domain